MSPLEIDVTRPHPARIYDYMLGGKDNFAADREVANQVAGRVARDAHLHPGEQEVHRPRRPVHGREAGIGQFLDIGSGLPTVANVHEVAQAVNPAARVVYVDSDPLVLAHARALLTSSPEGKCAYFTRTCGNRRRSSATRLRGRRWTSPGRSR